MTKTSLSARTGTNTWRRTVGVLNGDDDQAAKNLSAIEVLARESSLPVEEVKEVYEGELARLRDGARITDFLVLFASRRTRSALAHRHR